MSFQSGSSRRPGGALVPSLVRLTTGLAPVADTQTSSRTAFLCRADGNDRVRRQSTDEEGTVARADHDSADETGQALLVVDAINDFAHDDADALLDSFRRRTAGMEAALTRAHSARIPVVYVNDANGRWDGDGPGLVRHAIERGRGGEVIDRLAPTRGDLFFFKRRYSALDNTPLRQVLADLGVGHVLLMGAATEGCVVQTGIDARELGLKATILASACATVDEELERLALDYAERVAGIRVEAG
jgi:nicotinamidase-related amidase